MEILKHLISFYFSSTRQWGPGPGRAGPASVAGVNVRVWVAWARGCGRRTRRTRARSLRGDLELRHQLGPGAGRRGRLVAARTLRSLAASPKCRQSAVAATLSVKMPPPLATYIDQAEKFLLIKSSPAQSNPDPMIKSASSSYSGKDKNQDFRRINKHTSIGPRGRPQNCLLTSILSANGPNMNGKVAKILLRCSWQL